ncbi:hypothetical protein CHS0354_009592 [Potamilus streckersoni]|uniref:Uncharacterized protein n=1 Tax=Potamilus streckersoni TaxID=2493646 RepID=A0AAE0SQ97_9BIVA|nr:hypothetical protein CHS0354_009592 [Potamilus streckersoni]
MRMTLEVQSNFTRMRLTPQIVLFILWIFSHVLAEDWDKIFAPVGQTVDINCEVDFPVKDLLHTIWYKNGVPLASVEPSGEVSYYEETWSNKLTITTNFSLRIFTVKKEDAADYTCKIFTSAQNNLTYNNTMQLVVQVPEKPRIIDVSNRLPTSFVVNWEAPKKIDGILYSYHLQWGHNDTYKTRIITSHLTNPMSELLSGLEPYTRYYLRVAAYTGGGSSEYSDLFTAFTDVAGPEEPNITNYTVIDSHSIYVAWEEPKTFYKCVNRYFIHYWDPNHSNNHRELIADGEETEKLITGLRTNCIYKLKVAGVTDSIFSQSYYVGKFSEPVVFELTGVEPETISAGTLAGILIGVGTIVAFGLIVRYRRSHPHPVKSEDPDHVYTEIEHHWWWLGVSSMQRVSMCLGRVSMCLGRRGSRHSAANDAIFFSKDSDSVRTRTLPSVPLLLEGSVSVEMHERENVYNRLMKTDSIPYDELKFRKTGSGAHGSSGKGAKGKSSKWGQKSHQFYKDRLDKDLSPTEFENMEEDNSNTKLDNLNSISPNETSESKQEHEYFVLETSSAGSEDSAGKSSQRSFAPQYQMNTESSHASYELAKNVLNLDDKQNHSDDEFVSTSSSPSLITLIGIDQMTDDQSHLCTESTYNSDIENEDSTIKQNASSDDYMESI